MCRSLLAASLEVNSLARIYSYSSALKGGWDYVEREVEVSLERETGTS